MATPEADRFIGLRLFYQLCALGLLLTALNYALATWVLTDSALAGVCLVGAVILGWAWRERGQQRELEQRLARASASERPRLKARLEALRVRSRRFSGDEATHLVLVPDPAIVLSTVRSRRAPLIEVTAGFWTTYADAPELLEAALAHEAGHVAARDVELFQRMLGMMRGLVFAFPLVSLALPLYAVTMSLLTRGWSGAELLGPEGGALLRGAVERLLAGLRFTGTFIALPALAVSFAWSALLLARELQADAFAVEVLGSELPVRALLETQLQRRQQQAPQRSPARRLVTWLIQPDLRWRATLPALRGQLGPRVELLLGLASGGFLLSAVGTALLVVTRLGGDGRPIVFATLSVLGGLSWLSYALLWERSRLEADRGARGMLAGVGSVSRFSLAQLAVIALWMHLPWGEGTQRIWEDSGPRVLSCLLALNFALWAAGRLALCAAAERRGRRPRWLRGLGGLLCVGVVTVAVFWSAWRLLAPGLRPENVAALLLLNASVLVASLLLAVLSRLLVRPVSLGAPG